MPNPNEVACQGDQKNYWNMVLYNTITSGLVSPLTIICQRCIFEGGKLRLGERLRYPPTLRAIIPTGLWKDGIGPFAIRNMISSAVGYTCMSPINAWVRVHISDNPLWCGIFTGGTVSVIESMATLKSERKELEAMRKAPFTSAGWSPVRKMIIGRNLWGWVCGSAAESYAERFQLPPALSALVGLAAGLFGGGISMPLHNFMVRIAQLPAPEQRVIAPLFRYVWEHPISATNGTWARALALSAYCGAGVVSNRLASEGGSERTR